MTLMETEYLKGLGGTYSYSQNRRQGCRGNKNNRGDKMLIGTIHSVNSPHSSNHLLPFIKGRSSTYPKLMKMGGEF